MKKFFKALLALVLSFSIAGCSSDKENNISQEENAPSEEEKSISYYLNNYEQICRIGCDEGLVFPLNDGTKYGMMLVITFTEEEKNRYLMLDTSNEDEFMEMVEGCTNYKIIDSNQYSSDIEGIQKYVGMTIGDMMNDGYIDAGYYSDSETNKVVNIYLRNEEFDVTVHTTEQPSIYEYNEDVERSLTIKTIYYDLFSNDFYCSFIG